MTNGAFAALVQGRTAPMTVERERAVHESASLRRGKNDRQRSQSASVDSDKAGAPYLPNPTRHDNSIARSIFSE